MTLLGTLLLPCLALTRDLANAAAAFGIHAPGVPVPAHAADRTAPDPSPSMKTRDRVSGSETRGDDDDANALQKDCRAASDMERGKPAAESLSPGDGVVAQPSSGNVAAPKPMLRAAVRAGNGHSRPALVTVLMFLSPYPILVGASTGGAVVLWRASDCVCVQVRTSTRSSTIISVSSWPRIAIFFNFFGGCQK